MLMDKLGKLNHDLTSRPKPGIMFFFLSGNDPSMAELFRLLKHYDLPRYLDIPIIFG